MLIVWEHQGHKGLLVFPLQITGIFNDDNTIEAYQAGIINTSAGARKRSDSKSKDEWKKHLNPTFEDAMLRL